MITIYCKPTHPLTTLDKEPRTLLRHASDFWIWREREFVTDSPPHKKNHVIYLLGRFLAHNNSSDITVPMKANRHVKTANARTACVHESTLSPSTMHASWPAGPMQRFHKPTRTGCLLNELNAQSLPDTHVMIKATDMIPKQNIIKAPLRAIFQATTKTTTNLINERLAVSFHQLQNNKLFWRILVIFVVMCIFDWSGLVESQYGFRWHTHTLLCSCFSGDFRTLLNNLWDSLHSKHFLFFFDLVQFHFFCSISPLHLLKK